MFRSQHQSDEDVKAAVAEGVKGKEWTRQRDMVLAGRWDKLSPQARNQYQVGEQGRVCACMIRFAC